MMDSFLQAAASKGGIIMGTLVLFLLLERLFPMARWVGGMARVAKNLFLASFNFLLGPLIVIPVTAFAAAHTLDWRPEIWAGWPGLLLDLLVLDFWIYWWHRINHVLPILWRFHAVHHLDETLDASSALRFHFGEVALSALARAVVIYILAVPLTSVVIFEMVIAVAAIFHHSNVKLPPGFERRLRWFIVTPSIHWVHHHALRADTDSSYATVLSVWDRLFGSSSRTLRDPGLPIGVEGARDKSLLRLLVLPFIHRW
jgi:sterol desaturase/sphingolipid hydroxylase (fatty acid hydroxylase superfamily)